MSKMKSVGYGIVSLLPAVIIYGGHYCHVQMIQLMNFMGKLWILFVLFLICVFGAIFYLFLKHFSKNQSITKKYQPFILMALILASPISFPLYWLYFLVIKKTDLNEPGFPPARE